MDSTPSKIRKYAELKDVSTTLRRNYQPPMNVMISGLLALRENWKESESKKKVYEDLLRLNRINLSNIKEEKDKSKENLTIFDSPSSLFLTRNFSE